MLKTSRAAPQAESERDEPKTAIQLTDVSVCYRLPNERINTLKEHVVRRIRGVQVKYNEFWALRKASVSIPAGSSVALIGRNGAGKSTLLKVIAQVQRPTEGRVVVAGRVAAIIELGAGFHPELTGRENIFVNGAMLGFSRRAMERKLDDIVAFSELGPFIDSPMRTYSSGMIARLAFSVAADADPDILIIDEALAVGDEAFQNKCKERMLEFRRNGVTMLYVTHAVDKVDQLCPYAIWLDRGRIQYIGDTATAVKLYREGAEFDVDLVTTMKLQTVQVFRGRRTGH